MNGLVYTAIFGGRDRPLPVRVPEPGVTYRMYTDWGAPKGWERVSIPTGSNPQKCRLMARKIKVLAPLRVDCHRFDWTLWIDGSHIPDIQIGPIVEMWLRNKPFAAYRHHGWDCTYTETRICAKQGKDTPHRMHAADQWLKSAGFPEHYGQLASTVLARKQGDALVQGHAAEWWKMIQGVSVRDQVSFMPILWQLTQKPVEDNLCWMGDNAFDNALFHYQGGH